MLLSTDIEPVHVIAARKALKFCEVRKHKRHSAMFDGQRTGYRDCALEMLPMMLELAAFARHAKECPYYEKAPCTCGLSKLRKRFNELLKG